LTIEGETIATGAPLDCGGPDCGVTGPRLCMSAAGWYIGFRCISCGPYSRESGYYATPDEAQQALDLDDYSRV
tara:strand:- start:28 stop:246 length:219 start_codon:yes stop_codon:yes gene_type:complete